MATLDPLSLLGTWGLARTIDDRLADEVMTVAGTTELSPTDDGRIRWAEAGVLTRRGTTSSVSRVLYVERRDTGWFVTFEDGRDFHPWVPGEAVTHDCAPDVYVGTVAGLDADRWSVEWQVTGPHKDYRMSSLLTRASR